MSDMKISDLETEGRMEGLLDEASATFAKEAAPLIAVRRAPLGHLLVHPRVNGRDVGWFVLDSGAGSSTIVPGVAEELGLEIVQQVEAMSVKGMISTPVRRAESLELGAITLRNIKLVDFELASWGFGEAIAGIVGSELFKRAVVEVELAEDVIGIHDPAGYVLEAGNWEGLTLRFGHPHVRARFEGDREGLFKIDLGATVNESSVGMAVLVLSG